MDVTLACKTINRNTNNKTLRFEFDLNKLLGYITLKKNDAEKEVLHNMNKIELMQCIGLKDQNGKLIYFGDILIDEYNNILTPVIEISNAEHILFFKPIKFLNKNITIGCKSTYSETLQVIGNVYINSDLFAGLQEKNKFINLVLSSPQSPFTKATIHIELSQAILN